METSSTRNDASVKSASEMNASFASRVNRWKRVRLGIALALSSVAGVLAFFPSMAVLSVPCLIAAFIAYLLYLDARDEVREVKARNWNSPTPRISKLSTQKSSEIPKRLS